LGRQAATLSFVKKIKNILNREILKCKYCGKGFISKQKLKKHQRKCKREQKQLREKAKRERRRRRH